MGIKQQQNTLILKQFSLWSGLLKAAVDKTELRKAFNLGQFQRLLDFPFEF